MPGRDNATLLDTATRRAFVLKRRRAGDDYRTIAAKARDRFGDDRLPRSWDERYDATEGDTDAVNAVLRVMKRRAKMLGLDEPERFAQVVELVKSEEYQRARAAIMEALEDYPEARSAVADALDAINTT